MLGGAAGNLTVQAHADLVALTTVDTFTYAIKDSATAIAAQSTVDTNNSTTVIVGATKVTATAVDGDDLTELDLSNVDTLDISGIVTVTDSQAALVDKSDTGSLNIVFATESTTFDLSSLYDAADTNLKVLSIDATNTKADSITLTATDVLDLGGLLSINIDSDDILSIDGDTDINDGITGWTRGVDGDTYSVYTKDDATLYISINGEAVI